MRLWRSAISTLAIIAISAVVPAAAVAAVYPDPRIAVEDAPVTRNQIVKLSVVQSCGYGVLEYRISNDGTVAAGMLVSYDSFGERSDWYMPEADPRHQKLDWTLAAGADGARTIYAQVRYNNGTWSDVVDLDLILARSGNTSLYIDSDPASEHPWFLWPTTDFHTRTNWPTDPMYATASTGSTGSSVTFEDQQWAVKLSLSGAVAAGSYSIHNPSNAPCSLACVDITHLELPTDDCRATSGTFSIQQIGFDASGDVLTAAADFRIMCSWFVIAGSIRYGSAITTMALDQDDDFHDFGTIEVGDDSGIKTLTFTNLGDVVAPLGAVAFTGPGAGDYETTADTCSNTSLALGASCQVSIRVTPTTRGWRRAFLSLPDQTARGSRAVIFESTAVITTAIELTAPIVPSNPGPARFVVTITPPPACAPELSINGLRYLSHTVLLKHDPERLDHIFNIDELPAGTHSVQARFRECDYYLASGPVTMSVTVGQDSTPPSGSIEINDGDDYTNETHIYIRNSAQDSESELKQVAFSDDGVNWAAYDYALSHGWGLPDTPGIHTVYAKFSDAFDNWSEVVSDTIILDDAPPSVTAPTQQFVLGSAITGGKVVVHVPWSGSDATSGIADYDLNQKTDSGAWVDVPLTQGASATATTGSNIDRLLAPQHKYTFRARATDSATNSSGWAQGPQVNIKKLQESSSRIRFAGKWKKASGAAYWGGAARKATKAGASATLTFTGRSFAWVGKTGPDRGQARVYVNGVLIETVNLFSSTAGNQRIVWATTWDTAVSRTVRIEVVGTTGRPTVEIDAFLTGE